MKPLSVLHLFSGDLWAGAEAVIFNILSVLKNDPNLKVIALSLNNGTLSERLRASGIETHVIPEDKNSLLNIYGKALRLFRGKGVDVIHSHRYKENVLALLLAKSLGIRRLFSTLHGISESPFHPKDGRNTASFKARMNYRMLNMFFTRTVAVSQEIKDILTEHGEIDHGKISVIHNGVHIPPRCARPPSGRGYFHIGSVGRMVPVKDFDLFLEAAARIREREGRARFSILGDGPLKGRLLKKTKDLGLEDCMEFLPPRPDPLPYYLSLDLYINTSVYEGIPMSILEAMACKKPVVASRVGGIPEIIVHGEHGMLIAGRDPDTFAGSCIALMRDKELRRKLEENASKRIASDFSSPKTALCYRRLYLENRTNQSVHGP